MNIINQYKVRNNTFVNVMQLVVVWGKLAKSPNSRQILQIQDQK
jgi:hypothetical protein